MAAGFSEFAITSRVEVFAGAPQSSSAASFGTLGINFRARKPRDAQQSATLLAARQAAICPVVPGRGTSSYGDVEPDGAHAPPR